MSQIVLKVDSNTKNIPSDLQDVILDTTSNGIEIIPKNLESFPMPWDPEVIIEGNDFILVGGVGPSGFGKARAELPLDRVDKYLDVSIETDGETDTTRLIQIFEEYGWL